MTIIIIVAVLALLWTWGMLGRIYTIQKEILDIIKNHK